MKLNKTIFWYSTLGAIVLLMLSLVMDLPFWSSTLFGCIKVTTIQDVLLSLFGGFAVGAIICIITYFSQRNTLIKEIRDTYVYLFKDALNIWIFYKAYVVDSKDEYMQGISSWGEELEKDMDKTKKGHMPQS